MKKYIMLFLLALTSCSMYEKEIDEDFDKMFKYLGEFDGCKVYEYRHRKQIFWKC